MPSDQRRAKRFERKQKKAQGRALAAESDGSQIEANGARGNNARDEKFAKLLSKNEDDLVTFVADINKLYQDKLDKPAPFITFVICGMQSAGKSTIMERFMNAPVSFFATHFIARAIAIASVISLTKVLFRSTLFKKVREHAAPSTLHAFT